MINEENRLDNESIHFHQNVYEVIRSSFVVTKWIQSTDASLSKTSNGKMFGKSYAPNSLNSQIHDIIVESGKGDYREIDCGGVQDQDGNRLSTALTKGDFERRLASTGGFLRSGNTTLRCTDDTLIRRRLNLFEKLPFTRSNGSSSFSNGWKYDSYIPYG